MYNNVLVALDLSDSSQRVLDAAIELVNGDVERLQLVNTVEPIPVVWGMESYLVDPITLQDKIVAGLAEQLADIGNDAGIPESNQHTLLGSPATEIRGLAAELEVDAIVIGSHGHSGWKILLGSTANALLHGATCDVLTVYIGDD